MKILCFVRHGNEAYKLLISVPLNIYDAGNKIKMNKNPYKFWITDDENNRAGMRWNPKKIQPTSFRQLPPFLGLFHLDFSKLP